MPKLLARKEGTPTRTTSEGLRISFASDPDGFFHRFKHDYIKEQFICLRDSVIAYIREACARKPEDLIFDEYASAPLFQITFYPEFISDWQ